jgi:hypothetical protein
MTSGVTQDARADRNAKAHKSAGGHGRRQADVVVRAAAIHSMAEAREESPRIFRAMAGRDGRIMLGKMGGSWLWSLRRHRMACPARTRGHLRGVSPRTAVMGGLIDIDAGPDSPASLNPGKLVPVPG